LEIGVLLTLVALVATLGSAAAARFWVADLAVHFRLQWAAVALAGCLILGATAHPIWAALAIVVAAVQALLSAALLRVRAPAPADPAASAPLRLMAINVWCRNRQYQQVIDCIGRERPDVVLLAEVTAKWEQALAPLAGSYAHSYATRGLGRMGLLLLSRWPMQAAILPGFSDVEPAIAADLVIKDRRVQLLSVHTSWPLGPASSALRDRQLALIGEFARSKSGPLIVMGDLNVSPFSPHFQALLSGGNLKSAAQGFGWQPTWPTFLPPAGIQIDHTLTAGSVVVTNFRRGSQVGSDHLPVVIDCLV
jgi:endonuclease/exonuclease/phosphatase (EEP) superfamily protein YafD